MPRPTTLLKTFQEAVVQRCSVKKVFLEISQNSQENTFARVSFLIKLQAKVYYFIKKETLAQVFFCEFFELSKNTFFIEQLRWLLLHFRAIFVKHLWVNAFQLA